MDATHLLAVVVCPLTPARLKKNFVLSRVLRFIVTPCIYTYTTSFTLLLIAVKLARQLRASLSFRQASEEESLETLLKE